MKSNHHQIGKTDSNGNTFSLTKVRCKEQNCYHKSLLGELWVRLANPLRYAIQIGDLRTDGTLRILRSSLYWDRKRKGWGIPIVLLKWKKSFPFHKIEVVTATTPRGRSYTGTISRKELLRRAQDNDYQRLYEGCLREVLFTRDDLKRKH